MAFGRSILLAIVSGISLWTLPVEAQKKNKIGTNQEEQYCLGKIGINGLRFRSVGPAFTSERISDFAVHPQQAGTCYIATSSGGGWKTDDAGTTFQPIFAQESSCSIGCISIDPNNFNIIWVGSGENKNQTSVSDGDGVYKCKSGTVNGGRPPGHLLSELTAIHPLGSSMIPRRVTRLFYFLMCVH